MQSLLTSSEDMKEFLDEDRGIIIVCRYEIDWQACQRYWFAKRFKVK